MIYRTDYHVHTTFSDGRSAPEDYIAPALSAGLSEIGFSEHLSLFRGKQDSCMNPENISAYTEYLDILKRNMKGITVRTGLEVDYLSGKEKEIEAFLDELDLDYRIGSVHYLGEKTVEMGPEFYEGKNIDKLYEFYFENVMAAVSSGLFDIIGHCDLIRIYGFRPATNPEPLYRKLAKCLKKNNVVFELNTNGRNRPLADFYPDRRFLHIFREENIPVCVNSDAHMPARVGQYFDEAYELLRYTGYNEMAVFENRKRKMVPF
jgi:histidinol-phosphatase (PHP family)